MEVEGCSAQPEGVDDDRLGVLLNYICAGVLMITTFRLYRRFGQRRSGRMATLTEAGMSLGYLLGGLCHDIFANRASDDNCSNPFFYPTFCVSYLAMAASARAWLSFGTRLPRAAHCVSASLLLCSGLIMTGATWCSMSTRKYAGTTDDCPASTQAACDATMMAGEALFYAAWVGAWVVVAAALRTEVQGCREHALNVLAATALLAGPGQILVVCGLPLLYVNADEVAAEAMRLYCSLRTGVTYIIAVLVSHLFTSALLERLLSRGLVVHSTDAQAHIRLKDQSS
jgi:hypothetical protein